MTNTDVLDSVVVVIMSSPVHVFLEIILLRNISLGVRRGCRARFRILCTREFVPTVAYVFLFRASN